MNEPYWWYVLFVRTNTEKRVVSDIADFAKVNKLSNEIEAFVPESEVYYRNKKCRDIGKQYKKRPLFPGYVFIETDMDSQSFIKNFVRYIHSSADVIKLLRYGENGDIALTEDERKRFEYLFKGKRCVEHSQGYIEGDKVVITMGPLKGNEGSITYINRHNRYAIIDSEMFCKKISVNVALEIVSKQ